MIRIHIICEGQTEELFVNELLTPSFYAKGFDLRPSLIGKPGHKGGKISFEKLFLDVRKRLLSDPSAYCTTFFDYYGLPPQFPGKETLNNQYSVTKKSKRVTKELSKAIKEKLGDDAVRRFIPYVQMYEFEALLFSDPVVLSTSIERQELKKYFQSIKDQFTTPEEINDNPNTAPSKRILKRISDYEKPIMGCIAALEIGLKTMRNECKLFDSWLNKLELLESIDR
jgi:hypothetical protein